jgi:cob(I)alamin adenosyltransferase
LPYQALRIQESQTLRLEAELDGLNEKLTPLTSFILPGGSPAAAHLHLARAMMRRAERAIVRLAESERVSPEVVKYANRLSDLLFIAARYANDQGRADLMWKPGANR